MSRRERYCKRSLLTDKKAAEELQARRAAQWARCVSSFENNHHNNQDQAPKRLCQRPETSVLQRRQLVLDVSPQVCLAYIDTTELLEKNALVARTGCDDLKKLLLDDPNWNQFFLFKLGLAGRIMCAFRDSHSRKMLSSSWLDNEPFFKTYPYAQWTSDNFPDVIWQKVYNQVLEVVGSSLSFYNRVDDFLRSNLFLVEAELRATFEAHEEYEQAYTTSLTMSQVCCTLNGSRSSPLYSFKTKEHSYNRRFLDLKSSMTSFKSYGVLQPRFTRTKPRKWTPFGLVDVVNEVPLGESLRVYAEIISLVKQNGQTFVNGSVFTVSAPHDLLTIDGAAPAVFDLLRGAFYAPDDKEQPTLTLASFANSQS